MTQSFRTVWQQRFRLLPPRFAQSWEIYASLLFLGFFILGAPSDDWQSVGLVGAAIVLFLALFFWAHWLSGPRVLAPVVGIVAIGLMMMPVNGGASVFLSYAAAVSCLLMRPLFSLPTTAAILVAFVIVARGLGHDAGYLGINGLVIVAVGAIYMQVRRSESVTARLRLREEELAFVHRLAERRRIAHDLHDRLGSSLSLIAIKAELARRLGGDGIPGVRTELGDIVDTARATLGDIRHVISDYRASAFDGELQRAAALLRSAGLSVDVDVPDTLGVDVARENMLAMIVCEAATNVVRHARAKQCAIRAERRPDGLYLTVADDGQGAHDYDGFGVRGMHERATQIGAALSVTAKNGTTVALHLPRSQTAVASATPA